MLPQVIVLLAVLSKFGAAGPVRHNGAMAQHNRFARFFNQTVVPSSSNDVPTSTPSSSSSSKTFSVIVDSATSTPAFISSTISSEDLGVLSMVLSSSSAGAILNNPATFTTPAQSPLTVATSSSAPSLLAVSVTSDVSSELATAVQSAKTDSRLFDIGASTSLDVPTATPVDTHFTASTATLASVSSLSNLISQDSTSPISVMPTYSSAIPQFAKNTGILASGSSSNNVKSPTPSTSTAQASTTAPTAVVEEPHGQSLSTVQHPSATPTVAVQLSEKNFEPVSANSSSAAPLGMPTYPSEEDGNVAMAAGFNKIYQNLGLGAQCSPNHESQAFACILGELAHCQANGNYATEGCPRGQSCYALPKPSGQSGVVVQCAIPSDAAKALAAESPSSTSNIMKIPSTSITESSDAQAPKDNLGFTGHLAQTVSVQSAASIASSTPTASQSAVTKQTSTMASQAKNEVVLTSQAAQVSSAESSFEPTPISPSVLAEASSPPIIAVTATAVQTQGHSPVQEPTRSGAVLPAASVVAGNGNPIVSFPSALPSPDDQVRPNQNNALQLVASTRAPQASLFKAQETISEIGNPATTEPALSSTPSTADGAGVSIVPLGVPVMEKMDVENGQATVTVTVTVTTTERAPPITITIAP